MLVPRIAVAEMQPESDFRRYLGGESANDAAKSFSGCAGSGRVWHRPPHFLEFVFKAVGNRVPLNREIVRRNRVENSLQIIIGVKLNFYSAPFAPSGNPHPSAKVANKLVDDGAHMTIDFLLYLALFLPFQQPRNFARFGRIFFPIFKKLRKFCNFSIKFSYFPSPRTMTRYSEKSSRVRFSRVKKSKKCDAHFCQLDYNQLAVSARFARLNC